MQAQLGAPGKPMAQHGVDIRMLYVTYATIMGDGLHHADRPSSWRVAGRSRLREHGTVACAGQADPAGFVREDGEAAGGDAGSIATVAAQWIRCGSKPCSISGLTMRK